MTTHPGRLTEIIVAMVPAFAGVPRPGQMDEAIELVLAEKPTLAEIADAREALLERSYEADQRTSSWGDDPSSKQFWREQRLLGAKDRARRAEVLAIVESRLQS